MSLTQQERQRLGATLHEATRGAAEAESAAAQAQAHAASQAGEIEGLLDGAQRMALRGRDLRAGVQELRDTIERCRLSTLNAALEATRLSEAAGKVLVTMADELRGLLGRSVDVLDEHASRVTELEREREKWVLSLGPLVDAAREVDAEITRGLDHQRAEQAALAELGHDLRQLLGIDPELGGLVVRGAREADELLVTLTALTERGATEETEQLLARLIALSKPRRAGQP